MFDGIERDWEPPSRDPWYTVAPAGQRKRRKRWQVDMLWPGSCDGNWWPVAAFYADSKLTAYAIAGRIMRDFAERL
jgi:hypothetical protein